MSIRLQIIRDYNGGGSNASDVKIDRITLHMDNTYKLTMTVISRLNPIYQALITVISILTELLFTLIKLTSPLWQWYPDWQNHSSSGSHLPALYDSDIQIDRINLHLDHTYQPSMTVISRLTESLFTCTKQSCIMVFSNITVRLEIFSPRNWNRSIIFRNSLHVPDKIYFSKLFIF